MDLSVIIVSYNVRDFLEQCLNSVLKASVNLDCEVFVVDNNSADGSCTMIETLFPGVRLIRNQVNKGYAAANNQALKIAAGRYFLLLNPDTIVNETTFRSCISFMDNNPDAGALGVRMINGDGRYLPESKRALPTPGTAFFKMSGLAYLFPKSGFFNRYYLGNLDKDSVSRIEVIAGAFMFLRAEAVKKTGFLDEDFFMYGEDIDYSSRLLREGYSNYYFPDAEIIHFKGESTRKENIKAVKYFYRAMSIYVKKHYSGNGMRFFVPFLHTAILISFSLSFLKNLISNIFRRH